MKQPNSPKAATRRAVLKAGIGASALLATGLPAFAAPPGFDAWRDNFRARAIAKGISDATWTRVMGRIEPDMSVFRQMQKQPEFHEQIWQYINRRASDWRIINGREALKKNEALFARIEQDFGVERGTLLALWALNRPMAIRWCSRTICARFFRRLQRWPGTNRAAAPIGKPN